MFLYTWFHDRIKELATGDSAVSCHFLGGPFFLVCLKPFNVYPIIGFPLVEPLKAKRKLFPCNFYITLQFFCEFNLSAFHRNLHFLSFFYNKALVLVNMSPFSNRISGN